MGVTAVLGMVSRKGCTEWLREIKGQARRNEWQSVQEEKII